MRERYNFDISLSVLNHLGRNLYRNIITVLGEAVSNSWDADANNVWISIDKDNAQMIIKDDGVGMSDEDFQEKFLKIGYSKRKNGECKSKLKRPYIGRKGIGKLALLSCAQKIHIATKTEGMDLAGGVIDNSGLDEAIKDDISSQKYILGSLNSDIIKQMEDVEHGTFILFEDIKSGIFNTVEYIKKAIALYFRFSLIDENFNIYVNNQLIDESQISDLADNTQFLWVINESDDPFIETMTNIAEKIELKSDIGISGYIASAYKPSNLKIRGSQEKATIDLFVNGRLRERDLLRYIPTARIVENYVFGQIHFNELDQEGSKDIFTSSREGVISDSPEFCELINKFEILFKEVIEQWDDLRRKSGDSGDPDNKKIPPKERKAEELFNTTLKDMQQSEKFITKGSVVEEWANTLSEEAHFNIPSYTECFISENLLRCYIRHCSTELSSEAKKEAEKWMTREQQSKDAANISYDIRKIQDEMYYLDMGSLANMIDKVTDDKHSGLSRSAKVYKPIRDAVGHTSIITPTAKQQLNTEYENIKARIANLLKNFENK